MDPMLKKLDAMAGTPKTLRALSIPITSAARETSRMNGNITCVSKTTNGFQTMTVSGAPHESRSNNGSERKIPATVTRLIKMTVRVNILDARAQADSSPSVSNLRLKTVMKAVESAPSANRSRNKFGMRKATIKAPSRSLPNIALKSTSRTNPNTRENITATAMTPLALVFSFFPSLTRRSLAQSNRPGKNIPHQPILNAALA